VILALTDLIIFSPVVKYLKYLYLVVYRLVNLCWWLAHQWIHLHKWHTSRLLRSLGSITRTIRFVAHFVII